MALVKISELPATATVLDTQEIPTNNAGVNEKITVGQIRNGSIYSITTDYNMSLIDGYARIYFNHSATTKLIQVNLPNVASSVGRAILFQNLAAGLSYINGNGANINFKGTPLTVLKLFMSGDKLILRSDGTVWQIELYNISIDINWINRSDWGDVHIGGAFACDTKSSVVNFTGQKLTLASGNTCIVAFDSGGTGSGILYVYNWTVTGLAANNEAITCGSGGYTALVNEVSGSSKNIDYNLYHGLGINLHYISREFFWNTTATFTSAQKIIEGFIYTGGQTFGLMPSQVDTNYFLVQSGANGIDYLAANGVLAALVANDVYCFQKIAINI
jgi:hypothetical protein